MHTLSAEELRRIYPESDGKPMAENTLQFEWIALIKLNLEACFASNSDVFIAADLFWYPVEGNGNIRVAPDVMIALGRPKGHRGSYIQFLEGNIAPQVVFEILSPGNSRAEMARKLKFYSTYGAQEYYIYDPDHNKLQIYTRYAGELHEELYQDVWISPLLQVKFEWTTETLFLSKPNGEPFLSYLELVEYHDQAIEALKESRQLLKREQLKVKIEQEKVLVAQQMALEAQQKVLVAQEKVYLEQTRVRQEQERVRQEQERVRQEQERVRQEQERVRQEQERVRQEQEKFRQEYARVKNSILAFQKLGLPLAEVASILNLTLVEVENYLTEM